MHHTMGSLNVISEVLKDWSLSVSAWQPKALPGSKRFLQERFSRGTIHLTGRRSFFGLARE